MLVHGGLSSGVGGGGLGLGGQILGFGRHILGLGVIGFGCVLGVWGEPGCVCGHKCTRRYKYCVMRVDYSCTSPRCAYAAIVDANYTVDKK